MKDTWIEVKGLPFKLKIIEWKNNYVIANIEPEALKYHSIIRHKIKKENIIRFI